MLRGGTVSENKGNGVQAWSSAKIAVSKAEGGKARTVSNEHDGDDWYTGRQGEIIVIPSENINVQ